MTLVLAMTASLTLHLMPVQQGSLEDILRGLEAQTQSQREAASQAWKSLGPSYLKSPSRASMDRLLAHAPYLQEPVLGTLASSVAREIPNLEAQRILVELLPHTLNSRGTARYMELLPSLSPELQDDALRAIIEFGGQRIQSLAWSYLDHEQPELRQAAAESLLLHSHVREMPQLLLRLPWQDLSLPQLGEVLELLPERNLPDDANLPPTVFALDDADFLHGMAAYLLAFPQSDAETFLLKRSVLPTDTDLKVEHRERLLLAYEAGVSAFRWRDSGRSMQRFLRDERPSAATIAVAWTLHRLGDKAGRKHLLAGPEERAKRNPDDWRVQLELGRMQVDVQEFSPAYKTFKRTFEEVEGTPAASRLKPEDYLYAARAAAGARRAKDSGRWLTATRYSPAELAPYRDLPEFRPYLKRAPFEHLFPAVAD